MDIAIANDLYITILLYLQHYLDTKVTFTSEPFDDSFLVQRVSISWNDYDNKDLTYRN